MKYELSLSSWDKLEIDAIQSVIASNNFSMGEYVLKFEKLFAKYIGSKYCIMVNSGSSANLLMIASLFYHSKYKLHRNDEVIVPAISWSTTYFPLYQYGLKIKFVDVDLNTLNYDIKQLKAAVTNNTRAIIIPNLLGNPNDFYAIQNIIADKDIILLEDNCESLGAEYNNKKTGTFGLIGTFSTFFSHHISTMEGGLIVTDDNEIYDILLSLRAHGWTRNLAKNNTLCVKSDDIFDEQFRFILPGYNLRPLEMSGAIGIEQLKKLHSFITERQNNAKYFRSIFEHDQRFIIQKEIGKSSWFGFSLIIKDNCIKRKNIIKLLQAANIDTRPIVSGNFANKEVVKRYFNYSIFNSLNNAEYIDKNGLFVGNHHFNICNKIDYLKKTLDLL